MNTHHRMFQITYQRMESEHLAWNITSYTSTSGDWWTLDTEYHTSKDEQLMESEHFACNITSYTSISNGWWTLFMEYHTSTDEQLMESEHFTGAVPVD